MSVSRSSQPAARLTLCELHDPGVAGIESWSPFCVKLHRALRVAGLAYERKHGSRPDAFKDLNPTGQVPVLLIDGVAFADSTAALRAIVERAPRLVPEDPRLAAEAWLFEELADTALNGFLVAARWGDDETWAAVSDAYFAGMPRPVRWLVPALLRKNVTGALVARDVLRRGLPACRQRFEDTLQQLEARAPARGYWMGESISVADIGLFPQLQGLRTALTPRWAEAVERRPQLTAWLDRVQQATRLDAAPIDASGVTKRSEPLVRRSIGADLMS